jgi:hypothetical protein
MKRKPQRSANALRSPLKYVVKMFLLLLGEKAGMRGKEPLLSTFVLASHHMQAILFCSLD